MFFDINSMWNFSKPARLARLRHETQQLHVVTSPFAACDRLLVKTMISHKTTLGFYSYQIL